MSTDDSKTITELEHDNGRKDVHIHIKTLDVEVTDPATAEAKRVIEEEVIPALAKKKILVTLIHKPTNDSFSFIAYLPKVYEYAEKLVAQKPYDKSEYCVVQHDGEVVTVSTL